MHIGIAGNIGCGKTTLTRMLSEHYGWTPKYEAVTYNPYLEDYYKDIQRMKANTRMEGSVVRKVAAPTVPERATTPAPPCRVCSARGRVFRALDWMYTRGEK